MTTFDLSHRVAIVTGAAQGIGRAVAEALSKAGAAVALVDVNHEQVERATISLCSQGGQAIAITCDVSSKEAVQALAQKVLSTWKTIDILVNNAGVIRTSSIVDMTEDDWDLVLRVNLKGAFLCAQAVLPTMMEHHSGKIVNISSLAARSTSVLGNAAYTASKAGLLGFTRHLAREAAPYGIHVNAICPGATDTPLTRNTADEARFEAIGHLVPLGRWGTSEEQAQAVLFLVSDAASFITGATLDVNGGHVMV